MKGIKPTETEIADMQSYYDDGNSAREVAKHFGRFHGTVLKYIKVRRPHVSEEERKQRRVTNVISWRQRTKKKLVEYKGGKCALCDYNKCIANMVFHHRDPSKKDFGISGMSVEFEKLKVEVDKCVLLCCRCHGEVHAGLVSIPV